MKRFAAIAALAISGLGLAGCFTPSPTPQPSACNDSASTERAILDEINTERSAAGNPLLVRPVAWDDELAAWAEEHVTTMANAGVHFHKDWSTTDTSRWAYGPADNVLRFGPPLTAYVPQSAGEIQGEWNASPAHREHVVSWAYSHVGVALKCSGGVLFGVEVFGGAA